MRVVVTIRRRRDFPAFRKKLRALGFSPKEWEHNRNVFMVELPSIEEFPLHDDPMVLAVEDGDAPVGRPAFDRAFTFGVSGTDLLGGPWQLARICRRDPAWRVVPVPQLPISTFYRSLRDGSGVDVYIGDTGIDFAHPEFGGRASSIGEYYSSGGQGDDHGHGTWVAGCAAGTTYGVCSAAEIFSYKAANNAAASSSLAMIEMGNAIVAHYNGRSGLNRPAVCNFSYTFTSASGTSGITNMQAAGIPVFASAGNDGADLTGGGWERYPAETPDIIAVGSIDVADLISETSNWGVSIILHAPGKNVPAPRAFVRNASRGYEIVQGTSFASPLACGVGGASLQGRNRLTTLAHVQALRTHLINNASLNKIRVKPYHPHNGSGNFLNRIVYLDPTVAAPENIAGLP